MDAAFALALLGQVEVRIDSCLVRDINQLHACIAQKSEQFGFRAGFRAGVHNNHAHNNHPAGQLLDDFDQHAVPCGLFEVIDHERATAAGAPRSPCEAVERVAVAVVGGFVTRSPVNVHRVSRGIEPSVHRIARDPLSF